MDASGLERREGGFRIRVRLTPKAASDAIDGAGADAEGRRHLKARVRAVPEKGKANAALKALLAKALGAPKSAVAVEAGGANRVKTLSVADPDGAAWRAALALLEDEA